MHRVQKRNCNEEKDWKCPSFFFLKLNIDVIHPKLYTEKPKPGSQSGASLVIADSTWAWTALFTQEAEQTVKFLLFFLHGVTSKKSPIQIVFCLYGTCSELGCFHGGAVFSSSPCSPWLVAEPMMPYVFSLPRLQAWVQEPTYGILEVRLLNRFELDWMCTESRTDPANTRCYYFFIQPWLRSESI